MWMSAVPPRQLWIDGVDRGRKALSLDRSPAERQERGIESYQLRVSTKEECMRWRSSALQRLKIAEIVERIGVAGR